jgi:hypothetical protein
MSFSGGNAIGGRDRLPPIQAQRRPGSVAPNGTPVFYDGRVEPQSERRTGRIIETMRGFALLAIGAILGIWGATLSGGAAVAIVAMGGVALVGGGGVLFLALTPRIEDVDRRRVLRLWAAGMLVVLGLVAAIGGAALAVPAWIALGVVIMLFGGAVAYVASRRRSPGPKPPDRPDS